MRTDVDIVITGGGTAGHTNPGIAVAQALVEAGVDRDRIHFIGGERGNEATLVADAGFSIDLLPGRGLRRSLAPDAVAQNAQSVLALLRGIGLAFGIVRRRKPDVIMCLGGYAAFAATLAGVVTRRPVVISEQNARASAVNRVFGRFATASALPYPDTDLPKGVLTGNPIRSSMVEAVTRYDRASARAELGLDGDRTVLGVWAGSLGATRINRATVELARSWRDRSDIAIHHVVGTRDWDDFESVATELADDAIDYRAVAYENRMPALQAAADLAICRCGASTTAELAVAGLPAVLVPLPIAPRDHQRANARELVEAGGAILVGDAELDAARLEAELTPLLADPERLETMSSAAASVARPAAAADVATLILDVAGERR